MYNKNQSYILSKINQKRWQIKSKGVLKEVDLRAKLDIFNFKKIAQPLNFYPKYTCFESNKYGHGDVIYEYLKNRNLADFSLIEHGVHVGAMRIDYLIKTYCHTIITYSELRKKEYQKHTNKNILSIGPYIQYAASLLNEKELKAIKNILGKTVLVFPSHSTDALESNYEIELFIEFLKKYEENYDTILISMYWKDIEMGRSALFESAGFIVVTAGHPNDFNFLKRLKSIISLADYTVSNKFGTHIGYCICEGKPHFLFEQNHSYSVGKQQETGKLEALDGYEYKDLLTQTEDEVIQAFSLESDVITPKQILCIQKYWGNF